MGRKKRRTVYSGIGGQAVLEGVMMKNSEKYAVAVRKPDGEIEVDIDNYQGVLHGNKFKEIPFIRGMFNFVDSMKLGTKCLNYSADFYEEEEAKETVVDKALNKISGGKSEKILNSLVVFVAIALAVGLFILLPYFLTAQFEQYIENHSLVLIIEGAIRIVIFLLYVVGIAVMDDIRRLYMYHGAEHKCINCIERGKPLTVNNVMRSSRIHRRCGTSFMFLVMFVSIILFFFIRVENPVYRIGLRVLLIPVIAGISYEIIRLAGRSNNFLVTLISLPGLMLQRMTTKEPTRDMVKVAIASVEAVFDWKEFLMENFEYTAEQLAEYEDETPADEDSEDVLEEKQEDSKADDFVSEEPEQDAFVKEEEL
ncbi:MAG: DUF1385 domain-containing protein [Lachnospiraceae bacterium]|nr:DUF1385 domain-containing protein [Lachnospiraceae bacterium]